MKRILLASALALAVAAPASAADLATRYPVKAAVVPVAPVFSWTGFYIGGNVGYGGGSYDYTFGSATASSDASGFIAGGQLGYNYQFANNVVLGVETDIQWSGIQGDMNVNGTSLKTSLDYFGTVRARVGYAFDRILPYVTGGFAYGKSKTSVETASLTGDDSSTGTGWTLGGGLEYAITNNWTFKTEYLYVDLGSNDYAISGTSSSLSVDNKYHTVKAGLNYKF
ncbi:outer membrane protein [Azorhizobium doebereinerae]|uniref:outer membrane protein n=1 Tax=Azorhizobium doebereinerae TaxID=281091 RepID=UPI000415BE5E|nr:outer membrane protein [Azorhizobium doebereinerae]